MKAQVWQADFAVSIIIVVLAASTFLSFVQIYESKSTSLSELNSEAFYIGEQLISAGSPEGWDNETIRQVGITENNWRINITKLEYLYNMTPGELVAKLGINNKVYVEILSEGSIVPFPGTNYVYGAGENATNPRQKVVLSRHLIYDSEVVEMRIIVWN